MLGLLFCGVLLACHASTAAVLQYYGARIAKLTEFHHGVSGEVFAVDSRTLFIKNFNYDGEGPAAYFLVGTTPQPSNPPGSWRLRDERGNAGVLKRYRNKDITLSLPEGKTLRDIVWFSVWCEDFAVNFGHVNIPRELDFPRPQKINGLKGVHGISSDQIVIVDAQTLLIPNFSYDGEAPDAKFWSGRGNKPTPQGLRIPDENGKVVPLRRYDRKTIVLTLPADVTVFDIGHFGVWCEAFSVDFAHVRIPESANVPPSLKMLGISPQSKLNCEVLLDDIAFEVRWAVAGESVVIQLVAKLDDNDYMSFGISPDIDKSVMIGSDVAVAWIDKKTGKGFANDYYLEAKSQCSGSHGSCPDPVFEKNTNSIRLLNAAMVNGFSIVTYQRPLRASDRFDLPVYTNRTQAIVWAIGPLNDKTETSYHHKVLRKTRLINFGRQPTWNCPVPDSEKKDFERDSEDRPQSEAYISSPNRRGSETYYSENKLPQAPVKEVQGQFETVERPTRPKPKPTRPQVTPRPAAKDGAWEIPPIQCFEPEDGVFYAQMGPTGGKQGYSAITGHVGWGVSIYINGLLIPEINVVRGKTYTFVVETGDNPDVPAKYHPFYITDDPIGGYHHKTDEERAQVQVFAGVTKLRNGDIAPTGTGRLCNWEPDLDGPQSDAYPSFGAYQRSLTLKCEEGEPGIITWTPDANTPDTVFYQCFTHRYLGWRINVHDDCEDDAVGAGSEQEAYLERADDVQAAPSIRHETKLPPGPNFIKNQDKELFKNHNMNSAPPKVTVDLQKNSEISKIIADGIRAAEALEEKLTSNTTQLLNNPEIYPKGPVGPDRIQAMRPYPSNVNVFLRPPPPAKYRRPMVHMHMDPRYPRPQRPYILPQPSLIVNHYKKPPMNMYQRHFTKPQHPMQHIGPILLLGEASEIKMVKKPEVALMDMPYQMGEKHLLQRPMMKEKPLLENKPLAKITAYKPPFELRKDRVPLRGFEGFKPETVVVEGGFKPIVRRREDVEENGEREPLFERIEREDREDTFSDFKEDNFEPMFKPSPLESVENPQPEKLTGDLKEMNVEDGEDKMAMAAEHYEQYLPEGSVVTYDGKAVLDTALVGQQPFNEVRKQSSKIGDLIKKPQFGPFRGEIPPLIPEFANYDHHPFDGYKKNDTEKPISTKLTIVSQTKPEDADEDEKELRREKRDAHHHPDHHEDGPAASMGTHLAISWACFLISRLLLF